MSNIDATAVPADPRSAERLRASGFDYRVLDAADVAAIDAFSRADARGFLDPEPSREHLDGVRPSLAARRNIGVFETGAAEGALPIATVNSWVTPLTVSGGELPMWAISSVTVAATHRRRGIARNLLEGELRAAADAGVPVAGLTASEATIYGRYGFAPAVPVARVAIDTRRAGWQAAAAPGRLEYVDREQLAVDLSELHEGARRARAGQISGWPYRWRRTAGLADEGGKGAAVRGVRYLDAAGVVRGILAYRLAEQADGFRFTLTIAQLTTQTDEALRALWGFAVTHDLVTRVEADLRPLDDPIVHLVADQRAVEFTVHDHGWLRVLDVPAVLTARTYRAPLDVVLRVTDPLGFAEGTWRLVVGADGRAEVATTDAAADLSLSVVELSAILVGGVSATHLAAAGRIQADEAVSASVDDAFRAQRAPLLGIWY
ncbi:GNAT family N-acetyltransferase [Microbacterium sp.]|uniref:GNAT family N-acetyltransferase n=1 Tax=Microbacterium sp. TaxID=51671 RepID=UPI0039E61025